MRDVYFSYFILSLAGVSVCAYLARAALRGRARHARTDADGGSVFLNKASMEMGYWVLQPLVDLLVAVRATPNGVTLFCLLPALGAGVAAATGWLGLACVLATSAAVGDILDGLLARRLGTASDSGEVIDAAVDRYQEFFFIGGLVVYYRSHWVVSVLALSVMLGAFMVSYTTAKAEAMGVPPPRGSMRRAERSVYLYFGAGLTPVTHVLFAGSPSHALRELPMILALTIVGVVSNVSAVQRFATLAQALRAKRGQREMALAAPEPAREPVSAAAPVGRTDTPAGLV